MKNFITISCLLTCSLLIGCGGTDTETLTTSEAAAPIELTQEEVQILDSIETAPAEEAAPVTKENYEDVLKQLEEEVDADQ